MRILVFVLLAICLAPAPAAGHPHVFIDTELAFVFDAQGLAGIHQRWVFDEMFSAQIMDMVDGNGDGLLSEAESHATEREAFVNLKNFNYFTHATLNGRKLAFAKAMDFRARCNDGILSYEFLLPLSAPVAGKVQGLVVAVYDQSYYSDMALVETAPKLMGANVFRTGIEVQEAEPVHTEWGPIMPKEVVLTFGPR